MGIEGSPMLTSPPEAAAPIKLDVIPNPNPTRGSQTEAATLSPKLLAGDLEKPQLSPEQTEEVLKKLLESETPTGEATENAGEKQETREEIKNRVNKEWRRTLRFVADAYSTDPEVVKEQLEEEGQETDKKAVQAEITRRQDELKNKPKLKEAFEIREKVKEIKTQAAKAIEDIAAEVKKEEGRELTDEEKELIIADYYNEDTGIYRELDEKGEVVAEVNLKEAVEPIVEELKDLAGESEEILDLHDSLSSRMVKKEGVVQGFHLEPKTDLTDRERQKVKEKVEKAQEFLLERVAEIIGDVEKYPQIDQFMTEMLYLALGIDPSKKYAGRIVEGALQLLDHRLARMTGKESQELRKKVKTHFDKLHNKFPEEKHAGIDLINDLAKEINLSEREWMEYIAKDMSPEEVINDLIGKAQNKAKYENSLELFDQLEDALKGLISDENAFKNNAIFTKLKNYYTKHGITNIPDDKILKERIKKSRLFPEEEKSIKGKLMLFGYAAFMIMQLLQVADAKEAAAGTGGQGGEAPAG